MKGSRARPNSEPTSHGVGRPRDPRRGAGAQRRRGRRRDRRDARRRAPAVAGARLPRARRGAARSPTPTWPRSRPWSPAVDSGLIDFDLAVTLTRAVGQTMARLADWEVAALVPRVEELEADDQAAAPGSRPPAAARGVRRAVRGAAGLRLAPAPGRGGGPDRGAGRQRGGPAAPSQVTRRLRRPRQLHRAVQRAHARAASATWSRSSSRGAPTWSPRSSGRVIKSSATRCCS